MTVSRPSLGIAAALLAGTALIGWTMVAAGAWVNLAVVLAVVGLASITILVAQAGPALALSVALALTVVSGHWPEAGSPLPIDRLAMAIGFGGLLLRTDLRGQLADRMRQPVSLLLAAVAAYSIASAWEAETLRSADGLFALLDSLGLVPFALYVAAPVVFRSRRDRNILLGTLVAVGGYLGLTALFETVNLKGLVFPSYIADESFSRHLGRARGPFLESAANGLALYACGVAAVIAVWEWRRTPPAQIVAVSVVVLCAGGTLFTLTRAIWLASALAALVTLLAVPTLRRFFVPAFTAAALLAVIGLGAVPGLADKASERGNDLSPVWDRLNTNAAAVRMIEQQPLFGVGWHRFTAVSPEYMRQADSYPLTGENIPVHNVFLARAAELGLVGAALYLAALALAVYAGAIRAGPESLRPWQIGFIAIAIHWLIVANFVPLTFAFPNALFWLWAGLVSVPTPRVEDGREPAAAPRSFERGAKSATAT